MKIILVNLIAITALLIGGYLAVQGKDGWGWFLFIALMTGHSFKTEATINKTEQ